MALASLMPVALAAQGGAPQNTAGGPLTTMFRNQTLGRQRLIAQAFDSIPESKFGYKLTPASLTIGYIAQHLTNDNYFYCNSFGAMKGTRAVKDTATADSVKATWPKDTLVAQLKTSLAFCESALAQLDDAKLVETFEAQTGRGPVQVLRAQRVLGHVTDMADHYSQLANYMRANGMLPPSALPRPGGRGGE